MGPSCVSFADHKKIQFITTNRELLVDKLRKIVGTMSQLDLPAPLKPFDGVTEDFATWCEKFGTFLVENGGLHPSIPKPSTSQEGEDGGGISDGPSTPDDLDCPATTGSSSSSSESEESESDPKKRTSESEPSDPAQLGEEDGIDHSARPGFFGTGDTSISFSLHKKRKLSPTLKSMIGEAHVRFARGEKDLAVELCMEVIKEVPIAPDPYHALAMIFESDPRKSVQYLFIAGFLQPRGFKDWARIGQLSLEFGNTRQAIMCYRKAVMQEPEDPTTHLRYAQILERTDDMKGALRLYTKFLSEFPEDGLHCVTALRRTACLHHKLGDIQKAHESLSEALKSFPEHITSAETNLMLDLCIALKLYVEACRVLITFERVIFYPTIPEIAFESRESLSIMLQAGVCDCTPPEDFEVDLLAKLITVLVHLEAYSLTEKLGHKMLENSSQIYGDLYLDIAESYMAKRNYELALTFLVPLIRSETYSQAAVWLRYAECLYLLVRLEEAVSAYEAVIKLAPNHFLAKLNLSVILQKLGRSDDALETLRQDVEEEFLDPDLSMEKCHILYKRKHYKEFIELGMALLSRHSIEVNDIEDALVIVMASNVGKRYHSVSTDREERGIPVVPPPLKFVEKEANLEREYKLYVRLCRLFLHSERWDLLAAITYGACTSKVFSQIPTLEAECEFHTFVSTSYIGDEDILPHLMRIALGRHSTSTLVLNIFGIALHMCDHSRYTRHVTRLLEKSPSDNRLILLNAHLSFATGTYKNALMEYLTLYTQTPEDPLVPLMISSVLLHLMGQKTSQNRLQLALNTVSFMRRYMGLRGKCQEVYYNVGRIYHSLGLLSLAIHFYQLVLETPPPLDEQESTSQNVPNDSNVLDLKCEAAFNLAQLYTKSGAHALARHYIHKYIRI